MRILIGSMFLLTAACVKPSATTEPSAAPEAPVARPLSYTQPATPTLAYEFADTSISDIQAGAAGAIRVSTASSGTADLKFEPDGNLLKVTLTFRQFTGAFNNSAGGGPVSASAADIKGPAVISITARGVVTVAQKPELTQAFRQVSQGSDNIFKRFFVRLPARSVRIGATWTDTIASEDLNDGLTSKLQSVARSTYARDTVVADRTFNVITAEGERTLTVSGTTQGVEIVQRLNGTASSVTLWDPEKRVVFSRSENVTMTGAFDLPALGMTNMPIAATGRSILQLKE